MSWYTLQTNPNYESKVMEQIEQRKIEKNLPIREIFSPEETIVSFKNGQKKERKKKLYSNYVFIEMDYSNEVWHALKGIKGIVGFIGDKNSPMVVPNRDIEKMKSKTLSDTPRPKVLFEINSKVRITSGSFADFYGVIKFVDYEKNKAKISITIFNRETEVDLDLPLLELAK